MAYDFSCPVLVVYKMVAYKKSIVIDVFFNWSHISGQCSHFIPPENTGNICQKWVELVTSKHCNGTVSTIFTPSFQRKIQKMFKEVVSKLKVAK